MAQNDSFDDKGHENGKVIEPPFANASTTSSNEFGFKESDRTNDIFSDDMHENSNNDDDNTHNEVDGTKVNKIDFTIAQLTDRVKLIVPLLQKLPELTLEEMSLVRNSFASVLGEKEYITNTFELRVLMSELGLYPDEVELELLLRAAKYKLNLPVLCRYLRFYKKEFVTNEFASVGISAALANIHDHDNPFTSPTYCAPSTNDSSSYSQSNMFRNHVDVETLKAFVALGGNENGSGEIDNTLLKEVVDSFGLTIDVDSVLGSIDTQHSGHLNFDEFCMLWNTKSNSRSMSISSESLSVLRSSLRMSFSALNAITPSASSFYLHQLPSHHNTHHHAHLMQQSSGNNVSSANKNNYNMNSASNYPNTSPPLSFGANLNSNNNAAVNENKNLSLQRGNVLPSQGNLSLSQGLPFTRRASQLSAMNSVANYPNESAGRMNTRNTNKFNTNTNTSSTLSFVKTQTQESQDVMQGKNQGSNLPTSLPISHYEHLQLLYIFLFPEKFEPAAVSGKHARFKESGIFGGTYSNTANNINSNNNVNNYMMNSNASKDGMTAALSRSLRNSTYGRRSMKGSMSVNNQQGNTPYGVSVNNNKTLMRSGTITSTMFGSKNKTGDSNIVNNNNDDDNDSDALFITKAGAGVYRPPSPMILSLRNSTAYKKFSKNQPNTLAEVLQSSSVTTANKNKEYNNNSNSTMNSNEVPSYAQTTPARSSRNFHHSKYSSVNKVASETTCN